MVEFGQSFSATSRIAAMRAATVVALYGLPREMRSDLEQEAFLELWRKQPAYDPRRGSWRTFSERVVMNRMSSLMRQMRSQQSGQFRERSLESALGLPAPNDGADLRSDVSRVLSGVSEFDRKVAVYLIGHTAIETSRRLEVSRATVYRAIERLRVAFVAAGMGHDRRSAPAVSTNRFAGIEAQGQAVRK